jgi:hypothetical protein
VRNDKPCSETPHERSSTVIEILPESQGNILGVRLTDKVTGDDYEKTFIPALEKVLAEHPKMRCVYYMDEAFKGWDLGAMWDDATFGFKHRKDFEKIAVIGGPKWAEWGTKLAAHMVSGEVKTFPVDQLQAAWDWIKG